MSSMNAETCSARLAEPARVSTRSRAPLRMMRRERPGYLGDHIRAEPLHDLVEGAGHWRKRRELLDQAVAPRHSLAAPRARLAVTMEPAGSRDCLPSR